jgi:Rieske 2Fe-2S family protein
MRIDSSVSAPVSAEAIQPALAPSLTESRTLPSEVYVSTEVFEWEMRAFFEGSWVCLGRAEALAEAGSQRAMAVGGDSVLLVRSGDGLLHGFYNVCRHRGHQLLRPGEARSARAVTCPYHSWAYGLDGTLAGAPRFADVPGFDKSEYPLVQARVAEWHGWVFANASGDAPDIGEHAGDLEGRVAPWAPERLRVAASTSYVVRANWKTITENYHECYHCPSIHPELCRVSPPDSGVNMEHRGRWLGGQMDLRDTADTMSLTGRSDGVRIPGLPDGAEREVHYFSLFPNLFLSLHPDYVLSHRLEPLEPGATKVDCEWLFPTDALGRPGFDPSYAVEFWDVTNREDWAAVESVQRGLGSRGARQGPFNPGEDEVRRFMAMVAQGYLHGRV